MITSNQNETKFIDLVEPIIDDYGQLNANTFEEAGKKLEEVVREKLKTEKIGKTIDVGGQFIVQELFDWKNVVIKRLRAPEQLKVQLQSGISYEEYWENLKQEHNLVVKLWR